MQFIAIHARRNDFAGMCEGRSNEECFAPLSAYNTRVQEILKEFSTRPEFRGSSKMPVIMTSDEADTSFWDDVKTYGWVTIDHGPNGEDTATKYGSWYVAITFGAMTPRRTSNSL